MSTKKLTQDEFVSRCQEIYKDRYDYANTVYINTRSNVVLTCNLHGVFTRNARTLLSGSGCQQCKDNWSDYVLRRRMTNNEFISKAEKLHNNFYAYTKTNYVNSRSNVTITCPIHGDFDQTASGHLEGYGCRKCGDKKHGDYRPWFINTYFDRYPDKKDIPATLYLLYNSSEDFYKIGITTKLDVRDRIKYIAHYDFEVVDTVCDTMYNIALAEQKILSTVEKYKPKKRFGGYTECLKSFVDIHLYVPHKDGILNKEARADNDIRRN